MCGRYRLKDTDELTERLRLVFKIPRWVTGPRYNVAPSQEVDVIVRAEDGTYQLRRMRWGFVPFWEKAAKPRIAPINARSEEAIAKPMFRQALQERRCLIAADGFYEWKRESETVKHPFDISRKDGKAFFIAGIYENATEARPATQLLFTTGPNELMARIHDRMPVILSDERARQWLEPGQLTVERFAEFARPFPAEQMQARPISSLVNSPRHDGPEVLAPAGTGDVEKIARPRKTPADDGQGMLF